MVQAPDEHTQTDLNYEEEYEQLRQEFGNEYFTVSIDIDKLNDEFTEEDYSINYDNTHKIITLINQTDITLEAFKIVQPQIQVIRVSIDQPFTQREMIKQMISKQWITNDNHIFLEGFEKISKGVFQPCFGS